MENLKESLIEFVTEVYNDCEINGSVRIKARKLLEQLNSRPREPEAINRNEQAKECCENCKYKTVHLMLKPCRICNDNHSEFKAT